MASKDRRKTQELQEENLRLGRENLRLQRAVEELGILNEIATAINSTLALEKILDLITQRCVHHLQRRAGGGAAPGGAEAGQAVPDPLPGRRHQPPAPPFPPRRPADRLDAEDTARRC